MNLTILEKSFLPLLLATLFIVAFNWQFSQLYPYLIENFKEEKLSILYDHLFIYSFLILSTFIFIATLFNRLILKSKLFIALVSGMLLLFYAISYDIFVNIFNYFTSYPLTSTTLMGMVLFAVGSFAFALYPLILSILKRSIPVSHSFVFFLLSLAYALFFINTNCYPISEISTKFSKNLTSFIKENRSF